MAKIEFVGSFITILTIMIFIITASAALTLTGVAGDFGIDASTNLGDEAGVTGAMVELESMDTEPNMLKALTANIKFFQTIRGLFDAVTNITGMLVNLPLVPAWVASVSVIMVLMGSVATGWYLITNKKV
jgi:hypothetical protein|tara:strand:- start:3498 stop:3887 length:390 start_codon:yes stop_codon:yes gene_type:complete